MNDQPEASPNGGLGSIIPGDPWIKVPPTPWIVMSRIRAREAMRALVGCLRDGVPAPLTELRRLGRTLTQRAADVPAYFDRPGTSNGPTEALNGRLEHLRGSALGFRNLTNNIARSLLETGGFRSRLHPGL